jgi:transposase
MSVLSKDIVKKWIVPHLILGSRGPKIKIPIEDIVMAILYRLKTGCQWRELPMGSFFSVADFSWNSVFQHFNNWSKLGCWRKAWVNLLRSKCQFLDMSSVEFDGSHTPVKRGGQAVGYQGRKACKTSNSLYMSDKQGIMLAMASPQEGQHHDLYQIEALFKEVCAMLKEAGISLEGLFLNADPGFDSLSFSKACEQEGIFANVKPNPRNGANKNEEPYQDGTHIFDEQLYKNRSVIEHANAWMDSFKALLIRFETSSRNWTSLSLIAFIAIFIRKLVKKNKL